MQSTTITNAQFIIIIIISMLLSSFFLLCECVLTTVSFSKDTNFDLGAVSFKI